MNGVWFSTRIRCALLAIFVTVIVADANASGINSRNNIDIKVKTSTIKNIIRDSQDSTAKTSIGTIRQNHLSGQAKVNIKTDTISNKIDGGAKSNVAINVGSVEKSTINSTNIDIDVGAIKNSVTGGHKNRAEINIGAIQNSFVSGSIDIKIKSRADVINTIRNGSGNRSEINIGSITSERDEQEPTFFSVPNQPTSEIHAYDNRQQPLLDHYANSVGSSPAILSSTKKSSPASPTRQSTAPDNEDQYVIEKRQSSIKNLGGHNFLVLKDSNGKVLGEFHGLPVDSRTGKVANKGVSRHHELRFIEFDHSKGQDSGYIKNKQPSAVLYSGNKQEIMQLWERGREKGEDINSLNIPYPKFGIKLFGHPVNSNSVESTLSSAMGLESPKLKLPLTIQDQEHAIEYDIKPEQNFLPTPGEGRLIQF